MDASKAPRALAPYRGRFAPSPTGPLHLGSLATALGSWLDARAHGGTWLVRIEDVDTPRSILGMDQLILQQLQACGLEWDEEVVWQSQRAHLYQRALDELIAKEQIYACQCSRKQIEEALWQQGATPKPHEELIYPDTCRERGLALEHRAVRIRIAKPCPIAFWDRRLGEQHQDLSEAVGDFVLRRADGLFTYQLAVVVDDEMQGITHIVRGADLLSNTARQIYLQDSLGFRRPRYLHLPLVVNESGEKLSKQTQAAAIETYSKEIILATLNNAANHLGIYQIIGSEGSVSIERWLMCALRAWKEVYINHLRC
jgi:glutamyl-Q tRNA(Asp) synthetase